MAVDVTEGVTWMATEFSSAMLRGTTMQSRLRRQQQPSKRPARKLPAPKRATQAQSDEAGVQLSAKAERKSPGAAKNASLQGVYLTSERTWQGTRARGSIWTPQKRLGVKQTSHMCGLACLSGGLPS